VSCKLQVSFEAKTWSQVRSYAFGSRNHIWRWYFLAIFSWFWIMRGGDQLYEPILAPQPNMQATLNRFLYIDIFSLQVTWMFSYHHCCSVDMNTVVLQSICAESNCQCRQLCTGTCRLDSGVVYCALLHVGFYNVYMFIFIYFSLVFFCLFCPCMTQLSSKFQVSLVGSCTCFFQLVS